MSDCASESSSFKSTPYLVPKRDAPDNVSVCDHDRGVSAHDSVRKVRLRRWRTGREGHVVGSAGQDHVRFPEFDLLRGVDDRLESTPAQPVGRGRYVSSQLGDLITLRDGADAVSLLTDLPVDGQGRNVDRQSRQVTDMPSQVGSRRIRVQHLTVSRQRDSRARGFSRGKSQSQRPFRRVAKTGQHAHPKMTESTLTPSGSSASAALAACPPSCPRRMGRVAEWGSVSPVQSGSVEGA